MRRYHKQLLNIPSDRQRWRRFLTSSSSKPSNSSSSGSWSWGLSLLRNMYSHNVQSPRSYFNFWKRIGLYSGKYAEMQQKCPSEDFNPWSLTQNVEWYKNPMILIFNSTKKKPKKKKRKTNKWNRLHSITLQKPLYKENSLIKKEQLYLDSFWTVLHVDPVILVIP